MNDPLRLLYTDITFASNFSGKYEAMSSQEVEEELIKIIKHAEKLTNAEVYDAIVKPDLQMKYQFDLFVGKTGLRKLVPAEKLVLDSFHQNLDGVSFTTTGMKTVDFLEKTKEHQFTINRVKLVIKNFNVFDRHLPVIVRENANGDFEVLNGNHRAMTYIEKGYKSVPVLILN